MSKRKKRKRNNKRRSGAPSGPSRKRGFWGAVENAFRNGEWRHAVLKQVDHLGLREEFDALEKREQQLAVYSMLCVIADNNALPDAMDFGDVRFAMARARLSDRLYEASFFNGPGSAASERSRAKCVALLARQFTLHSHMQEAVSAGADDHMAQSWLKDGRPYYLKEVSLEEAKKLTSAPSKRVPLEMMRVPFDFLHKSIHTDHPVVVVDETIMEAIRHTDLPDRLSASVLRAFFPRLTMIWSRVYGDGDEDTMITHYAFDYDDLGDDGRFASMVGASNRLSDGDMVSPPCLFSYGFGEVTEDNCLDDLAVWQFPDVGRSSPEIAMMWTLMYMLAAEPTILESPGWEDIPIRERGPGKRQRRRSPYRFRLRERYRKSGEPLGTHASPRAHFRRGHFRSQHYGKGMAKTKVIWIKHTLVNAAVTA